VDAAGGDSDPHPTDDARRPPSPPLPDAGPFRRSFWRSPLRGPWLASFLSAALLPLIVVCALTGFLSHAAYNPGLGENALSGLMLLVWYPLVLSKAAAGFENTTGMSTDVYMERWLLLTAVLLVGSALLLAVRARGLREPR